MQQVDSSLNSSLLLPGGNDGPVVNNRSVVGVEVSSAQSFTIGSSLGAHTLESSIFGNRTGDSSQPSCSRALALVQAPLGQGPPDLHRMGHAVRHDTRVHGSCARSIRNHRSRSSSTWLQKAYRLRSRSRFDRSNKSRRQDRVLALSAVMARTL